ncbi:MAG: PDZ domain-containing protein [Muribaculaceae bacterium]|nr:PDZ domain-containing protein [Muribaculaceae bacterium]
MKNFFRISLFVMALAAAVAPWAVANQDDNSTRDTRIARNLDIFNSLFKELNAFYVDTLDIDKSMETAIAAMLDDVDPYTEYIPAKAREDFMVISTGEYGGIGSFIFERDGNVYISEPYQDSPAAKAGMMPGDRIVMIDGDSVAGWGNAKVSEHLKGQASTPIKVTVVRKYDPDSVKTFDIIRDKIKVDPVSYYGVTHGNIGYIALDTYNEHSAANVKSALLELKANAEVKYIILDLRGNGGGLLDSAVQLVGLFVPKGTQVLQTRGKTKQQERTYKTTDEPVDTEIPLAVLVDGGTASAAEITAGALQDLDRAVVMGTRSFGKGLVQATRQLPFDALFKVTVSRYYIPSGRLIQELDYSSKDEQGRPKHTVDTTAQQYYTAHGRVVKGGGGITPDIVIEAGKASRLAYNIVRDNWAFDYAVKYAAEHPTIPPADEFRITDEIFNDFKVFIDPDKFEYDKVCEKSLASLKETAETEGYLNDETKAEFERLEKLLKHDLDKDLDLHRSDIEKILGKEIIKTYYFQRGQMIFALGYDKVTARASEMFNNFGEYEKILNLPAPKKAASAAQPKKKKSKK